MLTVDHALTLLVKNCNWEGSVAEFSQFQGIKCTVPGKYKSPVAY